METIPNKILNKYLEKKLDKNSAIASLYSLIEESDDTDVIVSSIKNLIQIDGKSENIFKLLENLLIADSNEKVRILSANLIKKYYLDKALDPMKWAIKYESNYECLTNIVRTLETINNNELQIFDRPQRFTSYVMLAKSGSRRSPMQKF